MDVNIIRETVKQMAPLGLKEIIPSTMGEPLLYDHFLSIVEVCRENGIKLNLTTNGTWPKYGARRWAEIICPVASDVKISWNGSNSSVQEGIMKGSSFDRRLNDLIAFIEVRNRISSEGGNRCRITLQATFMENNVSDLPSLIKLAIDLGIDRVKGHQLWAHFPEIKNLDLRRSLESAKRWNHTVEICHEIVNTYKLSDGRSIILENFNAIPEGADYEMPADWECPFLGREAWVNHEGRFDPCCAPDAERKSLGYFGSVNSKGGMSAIWGSEKYQQLRSGYMDNDVCQKCNMRKQLVTTGLPA